MSAWDRPSILPFPNNVDPSHVAHYVRAQHHVATPVARNIIWKLWLMVKAAWLPQILATVLDLAHLAKWGRWAVATSMESPVFFSSKIVKQLKNFPTWPPGNPPDQEPPPWFQLPPPLSATSSCSSNTSTCTIRHQHCSNAVLKRPGLSPPPHQQDWRPNRRKCLRPAFPQTAPENCLVVNLKKLRVMYFKPQKVRCLWKPLLALAVQSSSRRYLA